MKGAAKLIHEADVLVFTLGAGMGVDSNLGTFRGRNQASTGWGPLEREEETPYSMSKPRRVDENPHLAWGYSYSRECQFRQNPPHKGYSILLEWAQDKPNGYAIFTSNIDGHMKRAIRENGIALPHALVEYHGSIDKMQCHVNCKKRYYDPVVGTYEIDAQSGEANDFPKCPDCQKPLRHNVFLIGDYDFNDKERKEELAKFEKQQEQWRQSSLKVVVIEIGAGNGIPTVRRKSGELTQKLGTRCILIRINLDDHELHGNVDDVRDDTAHVSIGGLGALDALEQIHQEWKCIKSRPAQ